MSENSRYSVCETTNGFIVQGKHRNPVTVTFRPTGLEVSDPLVDPKVFGIFEYYNFSAYIADRLMAEWDPPEERKYVLPNGERYTPKAIEHWARKQTAGAIGKRVHKQWKRFLASADPSVVAAQKAIFAATFGVGPLAMWEGLYCHSWVVNDIIKYRAAAIAARNIAELSSSVTQYRVLHSNEAMALKELAKTLGVKVNIDARSEELSGEVAVVLMNNWRGLFAPEGKAYRSLNRTLVYLPGGIPHHLVCNLAYVQLPRPVANRVELTLITSYAQRIGQRRFFSVNPYRDKQNLNIVLNARAGQIAEALHRVASYTRNNLSTKRWRNISFLAGFLIDYPDTHKGNIVGWADKSIAWHRDRQEEEIARTLEALGGDTATALPPIPLPDTPSIKFLDSVEAVCIEGAEMDHCIASYARDAVKGNCYLFHAEKDGDVASVQVSYEGRVIQAQGQRNRANKAASWAKRILNKWGKGFPDRHSLIIENRNRVNLPAAENVLPLPDAFHPPF